MSYRVAWLLVALAVTCGCRKDVPIAQAPIAQEDPPTANYSIVGSWRWVKAILSWTQETVTPASEGFEYVLVFSDDSVRYYTDGTLSLVLPYVLEYPSGQADPNDSTFELNVDGSTSYASFKNDTLILDDSHVDGGKAYYVRL